ncbi:hypothetical protein D3C72_1443100 [compost metagenome]
MTALRSSTGWRSTMSISLSPSRYWPMVLPDSWVRVAWAMSWLLTPRARALLWSTSRRSTLMASFQLSFTPRMSGDASSFARTSLASSRSSLGSCPMTRNCTGYGTGGPLGSSFTRARTSGNSCASKVGSCCINRSRSARLVGSSINCDTLDCGKIWSSGR